MSEGGVCQDCFAGTLQMAAGALVCNMCGTQSQRIVDTQTEMDDIFSTEAGKLTARRINIRKGRLKQQLDFSVDIHIDDLANCFVQCIMRVTQVVCDVLVTKVGFDAKLKDIVRQLFLSYLAKTQFLRPGFTLECYVATGGKGDINFETKQQKEQKEQKEQQDETERLEEEEFGEFFQGIQDEIQEQGHQDQQDQLEAEKQERAKLNARERHILRLVKQRERIKAWKDHLRLQFRKSKILRFVLNRLLPGYSCLNFVYAGLLLMREAVIVPDLIRWVYRGVIPLAKSYDYIRDIMESSVLGDTGKFIMRNMMVIQTRRNTSLGWDFRDLIPHNIERYVIKIFAFCEIPHPPINWPLFLKRTIDELRLPRPIFSVAYNIVHTALLDTIQNISLAMYNSTYPYYRKCKVQGRREDWGGRHEYLFDYRQHPVLWVVVTLAHAVQIMYNLGGKNVSSYSYAFQEKLENAPEEPNWQQWAVENINRIELPLEHMNWFRGLMDLPSKQFHEVVSKRVGEFFEANTGQALRPKSEAWLKEYQQIFREYAEKNKGAEKFNDDMREFFLQTYIQDLQQHADDSSDEEGVVERNEEGVMTQKMRNQLKKKRISWGGLRGGASLPDYPGFLTPDLMSIICTLAGYVWMKPPCLVDIYFAIAGKIEKVHKQLPHRHLQNQAIGNRPQSPPVPSLKIDDQDHEIYDDENQVEEHETSIQSQQMQKEDENQVEEHETSSQSQQIQEEEEEEEEEEIKEDGEQEDLGMEQEEQVAEEQQDQQASGAQQQSGSVVVQDTSLLQMVGENVQGEDFDDYDWGF